MTIQRRNFITGAALAAGATIMSTSLPLSAPMAAESVSVKNSGQVAGTYRTKVGSNIVTSVFDGGMQMGSKIVLNPDEAEIARLKQKSFIGTDHIPGYLNTFVIESGGRRVLIDTGAAAMALTTGHIVENLKAAGYKPSDITDIYVTHAHPDHVNGLLDEKGAKRFPKAQIRIAEEELQFWFSDEQMAKMADKKDAFAAARKNLSPYKDAGQIETFKLGADLGKGFSSVDLRGHTPGHSGFRISDGADQLLIWGDIVHMQALQFTHPEWALVYDIDPAQAVKARAKILDEVATDRIRIGGMHLSFPGLGHVEKSAPGYALVPQMWESEI